MLFNQELDVPWQCVTIDNEIREESKHLKENKKRKENRYNINLFSIITVITIIGFIVNIIADIVIIIKFRFEVNFFL